MGFPVSFFLLLNQITFFLLIVLQDKYNISVCGSARNGWKDSLKARLSPVSMSRHRNSICTVNAPILYINRAKSISILLKRVIHLSQ
jgi:hypothetical protein